MAFKLSDDEIWEMARIEAESECDISAGFDWGSSAADYIRWRSQSCDQSEASLEKIAKPPFNSELLD